MPHLSIDAGVHVGVFVVLRDGGCRRAWGEVNMFQGIRSVQVTHQVDVKIH